MESEGSSKDYFRKSMAELIAILPQEAGNTKNWEKLLEPLANATDFNVVDIRHNDIIDCPTLYIEYKKEVYPIDVDWYEYHFVEDTMVQQFSTEYIATLQQATNSQCSIQQMHKHPFTCYRKLYACSYPNKSEYSIATVTPFCLLYGQSVPLLLPPLHLQTACTLFMLFTKIKINGYLSVNPAIGYILTDSTAAVSRN